MKPPIISFVVGAIGLAALYDCQTAPIPGPEFLLGLLLAGLSARRIWRWLR